MRCYVDPPCHILSEIDDLFSFWSDKNPFCLHFVDHFYARSVLSPDHTDIKRNKYRIFPFSFWTDSSTPVFFFQRCVVNLSMINFRKDNWGITPLPVFIRENILFTSIFISNVDLHGKSCLVPVIIPALGQSHGAFVPSRSKHGSCNIGSFF